MPFHRHDPTRERSILLARMHRHYKTRTDSITLGSATFDFIRIADPQQVLDDVVAAEDKRLQQPRANAQSPLNVPYWAELWESSIALDQAISANVSPAMNVLDLGCGMGFTAIMLARAGARVLLADIEPLTLLLARLNTLPWRDCVRTRRVDWQRDNLQERFDLIVGGDILYERSQWPHLHHFWLRHLRTGAQVLLGEPGRSTGDEFANWAREMGWLCTEQPVILPPELTTTAAHFRVFGLHAGTEIQSDSPP